MTSHDTSCIALAHRSAAGWLCREVCPACLIPGIMIGLRGGRAGQWWASCLKVWLHSLRMGRSTRTIGRLGGGVGGTTFSIPEEPHRSSKIFMGSINGVPVFGRSSCHAKSSATAMSV